jgi:hypothetical protein
MGADAEEPKSGVGEAKSPKTEAEDNPWYLLATIRVGLNAAIKFSLASTHPGSGVSSSSVRAFAE